MRNVILQRLATCEIEELQGARWFAVEPRSGNGNIFCHNNGMVYQINSEDLQILQQYSLSSFFPADKTPEIIGMTYNSLLSGLYIVFANGDIIMLEDGEDNFQFVGDVPNGVQAIEWSPGDEFLVLVTTDNKVILMASSFDTVHEVGLHDDGFGQNMFVTVGWGKKETQFHGSEGKAAAKMTTQVDPNPAFAWDDNKPRIRWRGDSEYFAISYIDNFTKARTIRVFNRHGILQSTSEVLHGLEQAFDWKPSGNIMASTQRLANKHIVVFLEKNGLKHGEFTLPFAPTEVKVKELGWNSESSILAVWCEGMEESSNLCSLQLWASSNYHWHIKQTISFPPNQKLCHFLWDKDRANCLHVLQGGGKYTEYNFNWGINNSSGVTSEDAASVAVVDGCRVKLSNFRESVVPPPMCSYSLTLPSFVSSVAFASKFDVNQTTNDVCVVMNDAIAIFSQNAVEGLVEGVGISIAEDGLGFSDTGVKLHPASVHALEWSEEAKSSCYFSTPQGLHHWVWIQPHILLCVAPARGGGSLLLIVELKDKKATIRAGPKVEECVLHMEILPGGEDIAVFTEHVFQRWVHPVHEGKLEPFKTTRCDFVVPPPRCCKYAVLEVEGEMTVIGLNVMGQLFIDEAIALKNCTSFFVHSEFLLMTNVQLQLLCIPRTKKALELLRKQGQIGDGTERQIERGARLVVAVPCHTRVVLQMPRGNLETIQPRALALYIIQNLLDQTKYAEAFDLMRRQRINLNVFYDHNPKLFLENIEEFINQVKNPTWLCLFITDLMESDVTQSMYAGHYPEHIPTTPEPGVSKLDIVCNKMREALNEIDKEKLLLPVITTHIKQSVPNIGAALDCIRTARMLEQKGVKLAVSSDEALNYLFYIVDVYELFDVALGLYDFDLVMMVAAKSQKDPKEYLPFLNELRKLEDNYQRFTIDKHLKKYESALKHLSLCGNQHSDECLAFIKSHKLYSAALKIFPRSHALFECVCKSYAEALTGEGKYVEAGIMFGRSNCNVQAAEAFKKAGAWRKVLSIVPKLQLSDDELTSLYKELAHNLREQRQYVDSASVFGEYLHDTEERVVSLCMGRAWDEALRVTTSHNLPALVDTLIKSGVVDHYDTVLSLLTNWQDQLTQHSARLLVVREEKARRLEEEGDELPPHPDCDMFSDTSSIGGSTKSRSSSSSRGTGKTYRSSKNKRKHERKLLSLKEGSPYEDLALVRALHEIFSKAYQMRDEVHSLCLILLHFEMDAKAAELQTQLTTLLASMESKQADIWIPELAQSRAVALKTLGPDSTSNSLAAMQIHPANLVATAELEPHLCLPPTMQHNSWKLGVLS